ncbi:bifunctional DNA-formamidopyrimidine glycosylase/DNA-(apurinic or apyrimidinic site) lyase [Solimonas marina]|uniref:Formamidopyrimidine-DNA glycosylase n=1 Tax=Solimonas marina TaxID=2714601 RepID=A0A969W833_9GAMM|nr:bifunctional DNA-formamidopyrimidine glycosylase/DNA-(apurinic or apyrimidinic site) lyase [Solimonas marina]NKF21214.1 bifunctional DNA-formamidopyrimidine glycosylase/DNA-(apurinic or apyrimidinic site) lyase [Solimonas marina]
MPELPEVETVRRGLEPHLRGRRIARVTVRDPRLRWPVPATLARDAEGRRIESIARRGKYMIVTLDSGDRMIWHLGMSGRMFVLDATHPVVKHDHVDFLLDDQRLIRFHDPRRFGAVLWWPAVENAHPLLATMGPEPFEDAFNGDYLFRKSRGREIAVKNFIMDGHIVVGAGNIYAAESLFRAGIRPTRRTGKLTRADCTRLAEKIREVLAEAVERGGTTLRDFFGADGASGYFQQELFVYGRDGQPCRTCGVPIKGLVLGGRASCYCPGCQR